MKPVYEDNHIIIVIKEPGEIVQGDKTGDTPVSELVKQYLKEKYNKPGNVFCGVVHRLDRPVGGLVIFAKTSKALARLNEMLRNDEINKTYWALVEGKRKKQCETLTHYLLPDSRINKTFVSDEKNPNAKLSSLSYKVLNEGKNYSLIEIKLHTGRKHQIRVQLSATGTSIKGDLKYGAKRSNPNGGISLYAKRIQFIHPVSGKEIDIEAPVPDEMKPFIAD